MRLYNKLGLRLAISIVIISSTLLLGQVGCSNAGFAAPEISFLPIATEITLEQLSSEYFADEATADAKYNGKRLRFSHVVVDNSGGYIASFTSANVKFVSQDPAILAVLPSIQSGYILNITGICLGLRDILKNRVTIDVRWMESVKGDIRQVIPVRGY